MSSHPESRPAKPADSHHPQQQPGSHRSANVFLLINGLQLMKCNVMDSPPTVAGGSKADPSGDTSTIQHEQQEESSKELRPATDDTADTTPITSKPLQQQPSNSTSSAQAMKDLRTVSDNGRYELQFYMYSSPGVAALVEPAPHSSISPTHVATELNNGIPYVGEVVINGEHTIYLGQIPAPQGLKNVPAERCGGSPKGSLSSAVVPTEQQQQACEEESPSSDCAPASVEAVVDQSQVTSSSFASSSTTPAAVASTQAASKTTVSSSAVPQVLTIYTHKEPKTFQFRIRRFVSSWYPHPEEDFLVEELRRTLVGHRSSLLRHLFSWVHGTKLYARVVERCYGSKDRLFINKHAHTFTTVSFDKKNGSVIALTEDAERGHVSCCPELPLIRNTNLLDQPVSIEHTSCAQGEEAFATTTSSLPQLTDTDLSLPPPASATPAPEREPEATPSPSAPIMYYNPFVATNTEDAAADKEERMQWPGMDSRLIERVEGIIRRDGVRKKLPSAAKTSKSANTTLNDVDTSVTETTPSPDTIAKEERSTTTSDTSLAQESYELGVQDLIDSLRGCPDFVPLLRVRVREFIEQLQLHSDRFWVRGDSVHTYRVGLVRSHSPRVITTNIVTLSSTSSSSGGTNEHAPAATGGGASNSGDAPSATTASGGTDDKKLPVAKQK